MGKYDLMILFLKSLRLIVTKSSTIIILVRLQENLNSKGRKSKIPGTSDFPGTSFATSDSKQVHKFKYDKTDKSDVIILNDEDYEKIIEDFKEKMSM